MLTMIAEAVVFKLFVNNYCDDNLFKFRFTERYEMIACDS